MYYRLDLSGFKSKTTNADGSTTENTADFSWFAENIKKHQYDNITLQFQDSENFTLFEHSIKLSEDFVRTVDATSKVTGFQYEGNFHAHPLKVEAVRGLHYVYSIKTLEDFPKKK